jgi:hypothetical protein
MVHPATTSSAPLGEVDAAVRSGDHVAWLSDVLRVIALEAIGPGPAGLHDVPQGTPASAAIREPVAAATRAAVERLTVELTRAVDRGVAAYAPWPDDEQRRAELGYD